LEVLLYKLKWWLDSSLNLLRIEDRLAKAVQCPELIKVELVERPGGLPAVPKESRLLNECEDLIPPNGFLSKDWRPQQGWMTWCTCNVISTTKYT
jgi:hypothetical protein